MYQIFNVATNVNGEQRREKVMVTYPDNTDMLEVFHKLGMEYALGPDGRKYSDTGLNFNEFLKHLNPEALKPYHMEILWLDRERFNSGETMLINRYVIRDHRLTEKRHAEDYRLFAANLRDTTARYIKRLESLKADGHPLISTWDNTRIADRAIIWTWQFLHSGESDHAKFFERKLAEYVKRAGLSSQNGNDEQNTPQSANATDEQNLPQAG